MKKFFLSALLFGSMIGSLARAEAATTKQDAVQQDADQAGAAEAAKAEQDRQKYTRLMTMKDQSQSDWFKKEYSANFGVGASMLLAQPTGESLGSKTSGLLLHAGLENYFTPDFAFGGYIEYSGYSSYFANHVSIVTLGLSPRYIMGQMFYVGAKGGVQFMFDDGKMYVSGELGPQIGFDFPINPRLAVGVETNLLFFSSVEKVTVADWQALAMLRVNLGP